MFLFFLFSSISRRKICFILGISFVSMIYDRKQSGQDGRSLNADLIPDYRNEFFYLNIKLCETEMLGILSTMRESGSLQYSIK